MRYRARAAPDDLTGLRPRESERAAILALALALLGCAGASPAGGLATAESADEVEVLAARLRDGGSVYQPGRLSQGETLCAEWEIDPSRRHLQFTYEGRDERTTTGFFFRLAGSQLTLMGPHVRGPRSRADFGGAVHARVRRAGPGELSVGGLRWFLDEADCVEALDDPPPLLIPVFDPLPDDEAPTGVDESAEPQPSLRELAP